MAALRVELGQTAEAERSLQAALDTLRTQYGPHHPRVLGALVKLARLQAEAGFEDRARASVASARALAAGVQPLPPWQGLPFLAGGANDAAPIVLELAGVLGAGNGHDALTSYGDHAAVTARGLGIP
jgi:hypothetical protein